MEYGSPKDKTPGKDGKEGEGVKAHLHAAGKRTDGTWKLQFSKVELIKDKEDYEKPNFGDDDDEEMYRQGNNLGLGADLNNSKSGKKGRRHSDGDDNVDSLISDSRANIRDDKLTTS